MSVVEETDGGVTIRVKAVPGAKREQIAGVLGDRLKIKVSAPPEGGKANAAICALIAKTLGVKAGAVSVVSGMTNPEKVVRVEGMSVGVAGERIGIL
ncbi:MAG: DUF167 domain-containing protein [Phycisphaerales bacterium]|nr:DUF167 domain-containing protein [Phycisphaerales bacterium]